ncbi:MAG: hypothetical protein O2894_10185 [Planctomycetota bacterium]|nr:hypothetical protein [Planctomycetota bacterium]
MPLRRVPEAPEIVILSRSCGCVDARLEDDALVLRVRDDKRPHELVLMLGFRLRDGRAAVRRVAVVPTYPPPPSHGLIAELHASGRCSQVVGWSHLPTREPPRYDGDPRLRLRTRPAAGGGHEVLLYGLTHSSPAFEPGHVLADGARVPVRMYRR